MKGGLVIVLFIFVCCCITSGNADCSAMCVINGQRRMIIRRGNNVQCYCSGQNGDGNDRGGEMPQQPWPQPQPQQPQQPQQPWPQPQPQQPQQPQQPPQIDRVVGCTLSIISCLPQFVLASSNIGQVSAECCRAGQQLYNVCTPDEFGPLNNIINPALTRFCGH